MNQYELDDTRIRLARLKFNKSEEGESPEISSYCIRPLNQKPIVIIEREDGSIEAGKFLISRRARTVLYRGCFVFNLTPTLAKLFLELLYLHSNGYPAVDRTELAERIRPQREDKSERKHDPVLRHFFKTKNGMHPSYRTLFAFTGKERGTQVYLDLTTDPLSHHLAIEKAT